MPAILMVSSGVTSSKLIFISFGYSDSSGNTLRMVNPHAFPCDRLEERHNINIAEFVFQGPCPIYCRAIASDLRIVNKNGRPNRIQPWLHAYPIQAHLLLPVISASASSLRGMRLPSSSCHCHHMRCRSSRSDLRQPIDKQYLSHSAHAMTAFACCVIVI